MKNENETRHGIPGAIAAIVLLMSLAGCGLFWTAPGDTTADGTLQRDVRRMIGVFEGGSNPPNVVDTRHVKRDGKEWLETWVVDRSGTQVEYEVTFRPRLQGGTGFSITRK